MADTLFGLTATEMCPVIACLRAAANGLQRNTPCTERDFADLARVAWHWEKTGSIPHHLDEVATGSAPRASLDPGSRDPGSAEQQADRADPGL